MKQWMVQISEGFLQESCFRWLTRWRERMLQGDRGPVRGRAGQHPSSVQRPDRIIVIAQWYVLHQWQLSVLYLTFITVMPTL